MFSSLPNCTCVLPYVFSRGADLCSTLGDDEKNGNFICQTVHFGEYLCDNWSIEWVHFALLNTDDETFLNQLSY